MSTDRFAEYDAAYVLGVLSDADRHEFETHLTSCDRCAEAVQELAGLPPLLDRVDAAAVAGPGAGPPPPPTLLPGLLDRVLRRQRRRRLVAVAGAAAAVAATALGSVALTSGPEPGTDGVTGAAASRPTVPMRELSQVGPPRVGRPRVSGWVGLEQVAWGTRVTLSCRYRSTTPPANGRYDVGGGPSYLLVVRTRTGGTERVAGWTAVPGKVVTVTGATATARTDIVAVEVRSSGGHPVLRLRVGTVPPSG